MTQEEKQLLIKDLCARLPYEVQCEIGGLRHGPYTFTGNDVEDLVAGRTFKPYLRPMSSMTEEEFELLKQYSGLEYDQLDLAEFPNNHKCLDFYLSEVPSDVVILVFDWLNAHHFDYRLLIERGLALEAKDGMYK